MFGKADRWIGIIDFSAMPWKTASPGAEFKSFINNGKKLRILECTRAFVETEWFMMAQPAFAER